MKTKQIDASHLNQPTSDTADTSRQTKPDNATNETLEAITKALWNYHHALDARLNGRYASDLLVGAVEVALGKPWICGATLNVASNPKQETSTTADIKPNEDDPSRTESACEFYDDQEERWSLRDAGRNPDGSGLSYGERNV